MPAHTCQSMQVYSTCVQCVAGQQNLVIAGKMLRKTTIHLLVCVHWLRFLVSSCAAVDGAVEEDSPG